MAFPLINTWAPGDELTSAQMNAVSADLVKALDKTGDGVSSTPAGGISGTIDVLSTGSIRTLGNTNLVGVKTTSSGATSGLEVTSAGYITMDADSQMTSDGTITLLSGSNTVFNSGSFLTGNVGSTVTLNGTNTFAGATFSDTLIVGAALRLPLVSHSSNFTLQSTDTVLLIDTSASSVTCTLTSPGSTAVGKIVWFLNDVVGASHALTIGTPGGGIYVNGSALSSHTFATDTVVKFALLNDGTNWRFVSYVAGI